MRITGKPRDRSTALEPCEECERLRNAGNSTPPHVNLERLPIRIDTSDVQRYQCRVCGKVWLHENGPMSFGWIEP